MAVCESKTELWRNSAYHKMGAKTNINAERNKHEPHITDVTFTVRYQRFTPLLS